MFVCFCTLLLSLTSSSETAYTESDTSTYNPNATYHIHDVKPNIDELSTFVIHTYTNENSTWNCTEIEEASNFSLIIDRKISGFHTKYCEEELIELHDSLHTSHLPDGVYYVLYAAFVLFLGCLLKFLQERFHIPLPYTVLLFGLGIVIEIWEIYDSDAFGALNEVNKYCTSGNFI